MASASPFFLTKVECPICKTINEFETIKVGAYIERERDTDFCPTEIVWRNPRYQSYNPLLFFTATCDNCFYTREFNSSFRDWKDDSYFKTYRLKTIKEQHLEILAQSDSVIKMIGQELDSSRYPNETAILKLILAIIDETLTEKPVDLDLGRFYLRIGWLYRDQGRGENPTLQAMKGHLIDISNLFEKLKESIEEIDVKLHKIENAVSSQFENEAIFNEIKSSLFPIREKYNLELSSFRDILSLFEGKTDALNQVIKEHKKLALGSTEDDLPSGFHNHTSFYDYLSRVASLWPGIPLDETEALRQAVKHYVLAFEDGHSIAEGNQQIQASYLIAELSRRIGDYDRAKKYFNKTIRTGQEFIYRFKNDQSRTALARKILELAIEQGRSNMLAYKEG